MTELPPLPPCGWGCTCPAYWESLERPPHGQHWHTDRGCRVAHDGEKCPDEKPEPQLNLPLGGKP